MLQVIRLLEGLGLAITPDSLAGLGNLRLEETGDPTIPHVVACHYTFIRQHKHQKL